MAELTIVDVRPRHGYATVDLGEVATFGIWLRLINMSPFEIELDRAQIDFRCAGSSLDATFSEKTKYKSGEIADIYIKGDIPEGKANHIARSIESNQSHLSMHIDFNCSLHNYKKLTGYLEGVVPRFINANFRANDA